MLSFVHKGAWWEVDLGADVRVTRVKIFNQNENMGGENLGRRLSNSIVSLIDSRGTTQYSYRIGNATGKSVIEFPSVKLRVQLEGSNFLHMREVQVFDKNGLNVALNKVATQSSTFASWSASYAVNGNLNDLSHTELNQGK